MIPESTRPIQIVIYDWSTYLDFLEIILYVPWFYDLMELYLELEDVDDGIVRKIGIHQKSLSPIPWETDDDLQFVSNACVKIETQLSIVELDELISEQWN